MRGVPLFAVGLLVVMVFAGCLGGDGPDPSDGPDAVLDDLSEARFDVLPGESVWIPASEDGTQLHTRLFLPDVDGDSWEAPTILVMSPYFGAASREDTLDHSSRPASPVFHWLIDHFVPRGYSVAFSDVRGTGDSGGCLEQTAEKQRQDGYDVIEWLAAQDWSNGRVGMYGISYDGETQQGSAITTPPSLKTIIPIASVSGQYEWNFYDGVPFTLHTLSGNAVYMATGGIQPPTSPEGLLGYPTRFDCHPFMLAQAAHRDGDWDDYWDVREFRPHVENIEASVLYVHGLQDWNVRQVAIRDWYEAIPSEKRAVFGQWAHNWPDNNYYEDEWSRQDWQEIVHKWFDHYLLELDNGILEEMPPVQIQDSQGAWRSEETYPPTDSEDLVLHFGDGELTQEPQEPDDPLLFRENDEAFLRNNELPVDDVDSGEYKTELVFVSEALDQTYHVSGWPVIEMDVSLHDGLYPHPGSETDAHFAANLYRIDADGEESWYNAGYLSARHRDGVDNPAPVPKDETITYTLRFHPEDTVLEKGDKVKLVLAGSDRWTEPEGTMWSAALYRGEIRLPVIERDWDAVTLDVPLGDHVEY